MEIHHFRAFLAVADELHFGRAARRLHTSLPPLSRTIKQLETSLGVKLFDRTTRDVRLTRAGSALIDPAREVMASVRAAQQAAEAADRGETGLVRIGMAGPSAYQLVAELGQAVRRQRPGIDLELVPRTFGDQALRMIMDRQLDLAIMRWNTAPPGFSHRVLAVEQHVIVVPVDHRLADRKSVEMSELADEDFITLPPDVGSFWRDVFIRGAYAAGYTPRIVQTAPDSWTVFALVAAGAGITFTFTGAFENVLQRGVVAIPVADEFVNPTYSRLVWRDDSVDGALAAVLSISEHALPGPSCV